MLNKLKKYVLKIMYSYHYHLANYYYGKVDEYGSENNDYWRDKVTKHVRKEIALVNELSNYRGT